MLMGKLPFLYSPIYVILLHVVKALVDNTLLNITNIEDLECAGVREDVPDVCLNTSEHTSIFE